MTSTVPGWIAWPVIAAMAITLTLRYTSFNKNLYDNYLNNTLAWMLLTQLLRERLVEQLLSKAALMSITLAQHLSMAAMSFIAAEFMGFVTTWAGLPAEEMRRRQRHHRLMATVFAAAFLAVTTRSRVNGQILEIAGGWDNVLAWALFSAMPVTLSIQMSRMCVTEFRRQSATPRERLLSVGAAIIAAIVGVNCLAALLMAALEELGWAHTIDYRLKTHPIFFFLVAAGTAAAAATPVVLALTARLGLDETSRSWHQLQRLRSDMTTAVPESMFELKNDQTHRQKTVLQLHQTSVEIRDAMLQLRPYFHPIDPALQSRFLQTHAIPPSQREAAVFALQLAAAAHRKATGGGNVETSTVDPTMIAKSRSASLDEEIAELLRISRWWPEAQANTSSTV